MLSDRLLPFLKRSANSLYCTVLFATVDVLSYVFVNVYPAAIQMLATL